MCPWTPILEGALAERAREAADEIAAALADCVLDRADFSSGCAGLATFFSHYGMARQDEAAIACATAQLERATQLAADGMIDGLLEGFAGFGWVMEYLAAAEPGDFDPLDAVDQLLTTTLSVERWSGTYDVLGGLAGLAVYALARRPRPTADAMLEAIVGHLHQLAVRRPEGVAWFTPPHQLPAWQREHAPDGYYNLGLAHGVPGVIAVLAEIAAVGVAGAEPLARDATTWLLTHRDASGRFAHWVGSGVAHAGWCYGDPGVAIALFRAARHFDEPRWEAVALELALDVARRDPEDAALLDGTLCHGAFGLAHIASRLYHATGRDELRRCAIDWIERGLAGRRKGGIAGFAARTSDGWNADPGVLTGAAGIGLALLAATTEVEPVWDRLLLLDIG